LLYETLNMNRAMQLPPLAGTRNPGQGPIVTLMRDDRNPRSRQNGS
jgi:hypothetical protein